LPAANGVTFCREGGNRKPPQINWATIKQLVEPEVWAQLVDEETVPRQIIEAHTIETPNEHKLRTALQNGAVPLETVRKALIPGEWMTPKFRVRP